MGPAPTAATALAPGQVRLAQQAMGLLQSGRVEEALRLARDLAAGAPRSPDALQLLAMCHAERSEFADAERAFRQALALAPAHPLLLLNLGTLLRRAGRDAEALDAFRAATAAAPGEARTWLECGTTALSLDAFDEAAQALQRAVGLKPGDASAWHALGCAERGRDRLDAAEAALRRATALAPSLGSAWINLGAVLRLAGRAQDAVACFERARHAGHASPELEDALAGALLDTGRTQEALALARRLVASHPDFVPGHVTLADLLWEYGDPGAESDEAEAAFRRALAAAPDHHALRGALVRHLLARRKPAEALTEARTLRQRHDHPLSAWLEAEALDAAGETEAAGAHFAALKPALGGRPDFLNAHARHLLRRGRWDAAAQAAGEATRIAPGDQQGWAWLATAWRLLDDPREQWLCGYDALVALVEVGPPDGFASQHEFLETLGGLLDGLHQARREPMRQSLRGGSQTPGRLFGRPEPLLAQTRDALLRAVRAWIARLPDDPTHPFLARKAATARIAGSWSVKLWSAGSHANHIHSEGWASSAYYVRLPPAVTASDGDDAGCIQFGQPPAELGLDLPPRRTIRPMPGHLALFPSYLWHGTVPFEDVAPRMTIAFDMLPATDR